MEAEDTVQIEFTDEELNGTSVPEEGENNNESLHEETTKEEHTEDSTKDTGTQSADTENQTTETNTSEEVNVLAKTDAQLAVLHGVSEEEIKYARNMGWSPKEKFHGNPADWKGPKEFIDIAEQSAPVLRDRLREMSKKVTEMQKAFPTILEMQKRELQNKVDSLTSTNEQLQKDLEEAHVMADSMKAAEITEKIFENKLKIALTEEEKKHIGEDNKIGDNVIVPDHINVEKERAWRDSILPKLTLEQREIYADAAKFVSLPQNADKSTDERIAYIESKIYGRQSRPAVASVARPTTSDVTGQTPAVKNEYAGWDSMSSEEKKIATSMIEDSEWYQTRETDAKSKAMWNEFKKQFTVK